MALGFLILLVLAGLVFQVLAVACLGRLFSRTLVPLTPPHGKGITVFKPLKGQEPETRECLASFLLQDYHPYQVLFGVADPADPVLPLLKELRQNAPPGRVEVVLCPENQGHNPKVSILRQLEPLARYDLWVIADGDVKVGRDFLAQAAAALENPGAGLASCPYRAGPSYTWGAALEALTISADFIPAVAVAEALEGVRFALGAAMILSRQALAAIGGFSAIADFLADDFQLGWRLHQAGYKVAILPYVVETVSPRMTFWEYLAHQVRWTRTYRVCRPKGYLAYGLTKVLPWSLVLWLASGLASWALGLVAASLWLRLVLAWFATGPCLKGTLPRWTFLFLPLKDFLSFGLWLLSFTGKQVTWKNRRYRLTREGRLVPLDQEGAG